MILEYPDINLKDCRIAFRFAILVFAGTFPEDRKVLANEIPELRI
jgi:hypothetical protein